MTSHENKGYNGLRTVKNEYVSSSEYKTSSSLLSWSKCLLAETRANLEGHNGLGV